MTLRHLTVFKTVAETENFTKAAEKLYITQSAVSHAIQELEEEAKTPLFDRLSKSVKITQSGALLLEEVIPILSAYDTLSAHIGEIEKKAPVRVVSSITIASFRLPGLLRHFNREWPGISFQVEVVSAAAAMEVLRAGKADIAFIEGALPDGPFETVSFDSYTLCAVCAPAYPAARTKLSMDDFCAEKLLLREKGSAIRDAMDSALYLTGHTAYPSWSSVNSRALMEAAKAGLGIAVLPDLLVTQEIAAQNLSRVDIPELSLQNGMFAVFHKDKYLTAPLKAFLQLIEKKSDELKPFSPV